MYFNTDGLEHWDESGGSMLCPSELVLVRSNHIAFVVKKM